MKDKIIYQIDTSHSSKLSALDQFNYNNMMTYGSYSVRRYAERIDCDYELIRPDLIEEDRWQTALLEKTNIFNKFLDSDYLFFAFFDLDIIISDNAINIFDVTSDEEFSAHIVDDSWATKQKATIKKMTNVDVPNYINAGVYCCGRKISKRIYKKIKDKKLENLRRNDERFLSYVMEVEKIPIFNLKKYHKQFPNMADFLHYFQDLKEFMHVDLDFNLNPDLFRDKTYYEVQKIKKGKNRKRIL